MEQPRESKASLLARVGSHNLPIQRGSEMKASLLLGPTSIHNLPSLTTGHDFLHSCRHFFGLHFEVLTIAIRVKCSSSPLSFFPAFFLGGIVR